jgi:hypothetical protein
MPDNIEADKNPTIANGAGKSIIPQNLEAEVDKQKKVLVHDHKGGLMELEVSVLSGILYKLRPLMVGEKRSDRVKAVEQAKADCLALIAEARREGAGLLETDRYDLLTKAQRKLLIEYHTLSLATLRNKSLN